MLSLNNVTKRYGKRTVIDNVSVEIENGCYGVLGPNGAGKTTLFQIALGIVGRNEGSIQLDKDVRIGYLPQRLELFEDSTVNEMLYYFATMKKIKKAERQTEIDRVLDRLNLLERKKDKIKKLSGGMKQRIGIAQTLLGDSQMLVFDEPTVGLDPDERSRFKKLILEMKKDKTILISSHIVSDMEEMCDYIVIMNRGRILENKLLNKDELEEYYLKKIQEDNACWQI
jgi:ABC-2 type transport system ATP-binding protein